jgi:hypothetical protein
MKHFSENPNRNKPRLKSRRRKKNEIKINSKDSLCHWKLFLLGHAGVELEASQNAATKLRGL